MARIPHRQLRVMATRGFTTDEWAIVIEMGKSGYSDAEAFALGFQVPIRNLPVVERSRQLGEAETKNSENSKANRIETMKGPAESGQICSVGRRKVAKKIAKNKRCYANTLRPRSRLLLKVMRGVRGSLPPGSS
jgi:hypothetical protein